MQKLSFALGLKMVMTSVGRQRLGHSDGYVCDKINTIEF